MLKFLDETIVRMRDEGEKSFPPQAEVRYGKSKRKTEKKLVKAFICNYLLLAKILFLALEQIRSWNQFLNPVRHWYHHIFIHNTHADPLILSYSLEERTTNILTPEPTLTTINGYGQAD